MSRVWRVHGAVVDVHDGDTVRLDLDLGWRVWLRDERVRIAHIDAPELSTPQGKIAALALRQLLPPDTLVQVDSIGRDKYGRLLAELTLADGSSVGEYMLAKGNARPYEGGAR